MAVGNSLATVGPHICPKPHRWVSRWRPWGGGIVSPLLGSWVVATMGSWDVLFYSVAVVQAPRIAQLPDLIAARLLDRSLPGYATMP